MLPYKLLFNIGSKAVGTYMERRKEKSNKKHAIALQEMATGNERAKRNGSLLLDLVHVCVGFVYALHLVASIF